MKTIVVFFVSLLIVLQGNAQSYPNGYKTDSFPLTGGYLKQWKLDSIKFDKLIRTDSIEIYLLSKINSLRKSQNIQSLKLYKNDSAYVKCNNWGKHLLATKTIGHDGESYEIACSIIVRFTRYQDINKCIADELFNCWLNSPNHKAAMLNADKKYMISCNNTRYYYGLPFFSKKLMGLVRFFE